MHNHFWFGWGGLNGQNTSSNGLCGAMEGRPRNVLASGERCSAAKYRHKGGWEVRDEWPIKY